MLNEEFITEYIRLDRERDAGAGIWRLCEMSAMVVAPRGATDRRTQVNGATRELAAASRRSADTIERRAFAWRQWLRFDEQELLDENEQEIDFTHHQCRDRLYYSHFAALGRLVENENITEDTATAMLVMAVKDNLSVERMIVEMNKILEPEENFYGDTWPRFRKRALNMTGHPQVQGRMRRLLRELVATDWQAKNVD